MKSNNATVDTFSQQIKNSEDLIDKVANLTINNKVVNDMIKIVSNLIINNKVRNDVIDKFKNMTINDVGNDLNGANVSNVQVQFAGDPSVISRQFFFSSRKIGIRHEEVPVLAPPIELSF